MESYRQLLICGFAFICYLTIVEWMGEAIGRWLCRRKRAAVLNKLRELEPELQGKSATVLLDVPMFGHPKVMHVRRCPSGPPPTIQ